MDDREDELLEYFYLAYEEHLGLLSCRPEHDEMAWDARTGIDDSAKGCVTRLARHV